MNTSDFTVSVVLSQRDNKNKFHPVAFFSKKFISPELSFEIPVNNLYAIMWALTKQRYWSDRAQYNIVVYFNHNYLLKYLTNKVFTR